MGFFLRKVITTVQIMGKLTEIASFILAVIGLIWYTFVAVVCLIAFIGRPTNESDDESDDAMIRQMVFIGKWIFFSIGLFAICQAMLHFGLLYGLKQRKAGFVKCWLIVKYVEIVLAVLTSLSHLILLVYQTNASWTIIKGQLIYYTLIFLYNFVKSCACYMVSKVHNEIKEEDDEEKSLKRQFAYSLHHGDIEIAKANGKYMKF